MGEDVVQGLVDALRRYWEDDCCEYGSGGPADADNDCGDENCRAHRAWRAANGLRMSRMNSLTMEHRMKPDPIITIAKYPNGYAIYEHGELADVAPSAAALARAVKSIAQAAEDEQPTLFEGQEMDIGREADSQMGGVE